ncbi:hypothetical protein GCM10010344_41230 [Streptomyces bluensis]|nr:hypothetical protein GCM10010344_41230 [Streptomyces bluensis]
MATIKVRWQRTAQSQVHTVTPNPKIKHVIEDRAEPIEARPWRPVDGPEPVVWTWPRADRPALWVWSCGTWRWTQVRARRDWPDGRTAYQVAVDLDGSTSVVTRAYWWPHEGLRVARPSRCEPSTSPAETVGLGKRGMAVTPPT